jgi:GNAT superfamily N-acetyltransferase
LAHPTSYKLRDNEVSVKPRIVPETAITPAQDAAIRAGLCTCFPPDREIFSRTRAWHGSHPAWTVLVEHGDSVIAHVGVVERQIFVGREQVRIAGVQNAFVLPEHRGRGLFRQTMAAVLEEAKRRGLEFGLLFCTSEIGEKYARQGWRLPNGRAVIRLDEVGLEQPLPAKNVTMFYPLAGRDLPPGDLHLQGNDW